MAITPETSQTERRMDCEHTRQHRCKILKCKYILQTGLDAKQNISVCVMCNNITSVW